MRWRFGREAVNERRGITTSVAAPTRCCHAAWDSATQFVPRAVAQMEGGPRADAAVAAGSFPGPRVVYLYHVGDFWGNDVALCRGIGWRHESDGSLAGGRNR